MFDIFESMIKNFNWDLKNVSLSRTKLQKVVGNTIENEYHLSRNMGKIDKEAME